MPTMFDDVDALCPFFKGSRQRKIICEGITDECTTILDFKTQEERNQHRRIFCDARYQNCELHHAIEEKYDD